MSDGPLLSVSNLTVAYRTRAGQVRALDGVSFDVVAGEALALVGESGSGKSSAALAIMGLLGPEARIYGGVSFNGRDLTHLPSDELRKIRGRDISIVFQDPFTTLNPSLPVGRQVAEPLIEHLGLRREEAMRRATSALAEVGLPQPESLLSAYPHQLSGGMQQRVLIATALVCDPALIVLDEPTTALDVTVEAHILDLLDQIRRVRKIGMLFITHNLGVVNRIADRVCVIYAGRVLEVGNKNEVLSAPAHPYTKGLLASLPRLNVRERKKRLAPIGGRFPDLTALPVGCIFQPRCPFAEDKCAEPQALVAISSAQLARCWKADVSANAPWPSVTTSAEVAGGSGEREGGEFFAVHDVAKTYVLTSSRSGFEWKKRFGIPWPRFKRVTIPAVDGVSYTLNSGEVLGLVGESGSGKSTLGRLSIKLIEPTEGQILFNGDDITKLRGSRLTAFRRAAQIAFQNPDSSLNPRRTVGEAVARAVKLHNEIPASRRRAHVEALMERVGLPRNYYDRYPHQLSGGEKQRIGIARALATNPVLVVCDEPVSALDVSVQATVLNVLSDLRDQLGLSYLFISHDISVVAHMADRIAVMFAGKIVESGSATDVLEPPYHPYTEALLAAIPLPDPGLAGRSRPLIKTDVAAARARTGCPFHLRCPRKLGVICETIPPPLVKAAPGHNIVCHIPLSQPVQVPSALRERNI
jgi:peptide/nickel transport system ATP-binding protein